MKYTNKIAWLTTLSIALFFSLYTHVPAQNNGNKESKPVKLEHKLNEGMVLEQHLYRMSYDTKSTVKADQGKTKKPGKGNKRGNYHGDSYSSRVEENIRTLTRVKKVKKGGFDLEVIIKQYSITANLDTGGFSFSTRSGGDHTQTFAQFIRKPFKVHLRKSGKIKSFSKLTDLIQKARGKLGGRDGARYIRNNILNVKYFKRFLSIGWAPQPMTIKDNNSGWKTKVNGAVLPEAGLVLVDADQKIHSMNDEMVNFRVNATLKNPALKPTNKGMRKFRYNHARIHRATGLLTQFRLAVHGSTDRGIEHSANDDDGATVKTHEAKLKVNFQRAIRDKGKSPKNEG